MADYIERDAVRQAMRDPVARRFQFTEYELDKIPMADVAPVRHGRWLYDHWCEFKCSECDNWSNSEPYKGREKFCPNCGAKMDRKYD